MYSSGRRSLVVAVVALVAVVVSSESGDEAPIDAIQETAAVVIEGEPFPQYPEDGRVTSPTRRPTPPSDSRPRR